MKIQVSRKRKSSKSFVEGGWANYKVFVGTNPLKTRGTPLNHTPTSEADGYLLREKSLPGSSLTLIICCKTPIFFDFLPALLDFSFVIMLT